MSANNRIDQFRADVSEMKLKTGTAERDLALMVVGAVLMAIGVVGAFVTYQASLNQDDARDVQSGVILAITLLAVAVAGAALFVRYSIARFLRLWLLRQLYEGQANTDRLVDAIRGSQQ
jgi:uncharacterized membrane protein